jgi:hypothetical protein
VRLFRAYGISESTLTVLYWGNSSIAVAFSILRGSSHKLPLLPNIKNTGDSRCA